MTCRTTPADEAQPYSMGAKAVPVSPTAGTTAKEDFDSRKWWAGSNAIVQTRLVCTPIGQPTEMWALNVGSPSAQPEAQQDDAWGELFRNFAVAPEDVFGDDVHIPDVTEEVVEDNGLIIHKAAQQHKDSPALTTSSLTFKCQVMSEEVLLPKETVDLYQAMGIFNPAEFAAQCQVPQSQLADLSEDDSGWHTQQGKEADSPSVGREQRSTGQRDEAPEVATATAKPQLPHDNSAGPVLSSGQGNAGQTDQDEGAQEIGDVLLDPLSGSPGGLAPADLLGNEITRAAPDVHARPPDAMPLTQAPDMHMGTSQDAFASPEKAAHEDTGIHGASQSRSSAQKTTMLEKGLRAVFSPFSGMFGDKGRGGARKKASQAKGSQGDAGNTQHQSTVPATPLSASREGADPMATLSSSPRGAAVRQGLELIEQAHRLGGANFKPAGANAMSSGSAKGAASAGAAAGLADTHPPEVDDAGSPVTAAVDVDGQTVDAVLLQPMSAEAATEAARHQVVAPSGLPAGVDCIAVAPILAPEAAAQQQAPVAARPSRKRMEPGADVAGAAAGAPQAEGAAVGAPEAEPRQQKRRLLTGMAVVWRYFGIKDPKTPQNPTG